MGINLMKPEINGKELKVVQTRAWNAKYGNAMEAQLYFKMAMEALEKHPVDMLIFEQPEPGKLQVRSAGYDLPTDTDIDETTVIMTIDSLEVETFWFKVDNQGEFYSGTFLFPSDY